LYAKRTETGRTVVLQAADSVTLPLALELLVKYAGTRLRR
jgi:hypothetical protein